MHPRRLNEGYWEESVLLLLMAPECPGDTVMAIVILSAGLDL